MRRADRNKRKKRWPKVVLIILALFVVGIGAYVFSIYQNTKSTINDDMHEPVTTIDTTLTKKKIKAKEPLNILLLGIDAEKGERGRSDALMVLTLQPKTD